MPKAAPGDDGQVYGQVGAWGDSRTRAVMNCEMKKQGLEKLTFLQPLCDGKILHLLNVPPGRLPV